jgi:hypothetical protein
LAAGVVRDFDMLIEEGFPVGSIARTGALLFASDPCNVNVVLSEYDG